MCKGLLSVFVSISLAIVVGSAAGRAAGGHSGYDIFYSSRHYVHRGHSYYHIRRLSPEGGNSVQLTHSSVDCEHPVASPDGHWIAYQRGSDIWLMTASGGSQRCVVRRKPQWSHLSLKDWLPDGKGFLLYVYSEKHDASATYLFDPTTGRLTKFAHYACAHPSPSGEYILDLPGVVCDRHGNRLWSFVGQPCWSPGGRRLAVVQGNPAGDTQELLAVVRARDGEQLASYPLAYSDNGPWRNFGWAPTEEAVLLGNWGGCSTARVERYSIMHLGTGELTVIGYGMEACWSPDGRYVVWRQERYLEPLDSRRNVWAAQVVVYDVASDSRLRLTTGLQFNQHLTWIRQD